MLERTLGELEPLDPSFVSVTYRGGRESRQRTFDLVTEIQRTGQLTAMAHLICVGHRRDEMRDLLKNYADAGVVNVMALGGDLPDERAAAASEFTLRDRARGARPRGGRVLRRRRRPPRRATRDRRDRASDRRHLAEKLAARRLRRHPVLLRGRRVGPPRARAGRTRRRKAGLAGHHAGDDAHAAWRAWPTMGARVPDCARRRASKRPTRAGGAPAVRAEGVAPRPTLRGAARGRRARVCTSTRSIARRPRERSITRSSTEAAIGPFVPKRALRTGRRMAPWLRRSR